MDNNSDEQLLIVQATIEANSKYYDNKMKNPTEDLTAIIASMMDQIKKYKYFSYKKDSPKNQDPTTLVPANKKAPTLEGGHSIEIGDMWTLKHDISSTKLYGLLVKK